MSTIPCFLSRIVSRIHYCLVILGSPVLSGTECSGETVEPGKHVDKFKIGDIITGETMNWYGEHVSCRMGMCNQCESLEEIGFILERGLAGYMVAKARYCFGIGGLVPIYGSKEKVLWVDASVEPTAAAECLQGPKGSNPKVVW